VIRNRFVRSFGAAAVLAGALVTAILPASAASAAPAPSSARAATPVTTAFLLGDSVMAGLDFSTNTNGILNAHRTTTRDAKVCRRLVAASCAYQGVTPLTALQVMQADSGHLGDALVMMVGYNDSGISGNIESLMAEADRQHVGTVLWLTYRSPGGRYDASNAALNTAAASHANLRIADWNTYTAGKSSWFASDGLHLTGQGPDQLATFINAQLDLIGAAPDRCHSTPIGTVVSPPADGPADTGTPPSSFTPLASPTRLFDSRDSSPLGAGRQLDLPVAGWSTVGASAVGAVMNVTAVDPCAAGFVTVYPCGQTAPPLASNVNYGSHQTVANQVQVKLGTGRVCVYASTQTDVLVDVAGWFGPTGVGFQTHAPERIVDTRSGVGAPKAKVGAGQAIALQITGTTVPADTPAVVLNLTAVAPAAAGYLSAYPAASDGTCDPNARPTVSNVNYGAGQYAPDLATVTVGGQGRICLFSLASSDVVVDLAGWYGGTETYVPRTPKRIVDTRATGQSRLAAGGALVVDVTASAAPNPDAVTFNLTAVAPSAAGYLTAFPAEADGSCNAGSRPTASNVNYVSGQIVPNLATVSVGGHGHVCVFSLAATDVLVDLAGSYVHLLPA
jgi:hypothetical protein